MHEGGVRRLAVAQRELERQRIEVGDELHDRAVALRLERFHRQPRPDVRAADAQIHDVRDGLTGRAEQFPVADQCDPVFERAQTVAHQLRVHTIAGAQCHVKRRAPFREIDLVTRRQCADATRQVQRADQFHQQRHRFVVDTLLRIVEQPAALCERIARKALRVLLEKIAQVYA
jgi:hypothetical protein